MERSSVRKTLLDKSLTRRAILIGAGQLVLVGFLIRQMRELQLQETEKYQLLAEENRIDIRILPPVRGIIFDENGVTLAKNQENYRLSIIREKAKQPSKVLKLVSSLINLNDRRRREVLVEIKKKKAYIPVKVIENLTWKEFVRITVNLPSLPGIVPEVVFKRLYLEKDLLAHVIGYVGPISDSDLKSISTEDPILQIPEFQIGKVGVEKGLDPFLRGSVGLSRFEVNASGRMIRKLNEDPSSSGKDIHLTINARLQEFAMYRIAEFSASVVVIDLETGGISSLASSPSFDPNNFVRGMSQKEWDSLRNSENQPLANKAISGNYPPGSTFKMIVAIAALEENLITTEELINCSGHYEVGERKFHCWKSSGHGEKNLIEGIQESCDVFFYNLALRVGIKRIAKVASKFGIGATFPLPLPGVSKGLLPSKIWKIANVGEQWVTGDTLNSGIGQGFLLSTPLQIAVMTARLATGSEIKPTLVKAMDGKPIKDYSMDSLGIKKSTLSIIRKAMYNVVNNKFGTAYKSRIIDQTKTLAGKTGTSQIREISENERKTGIRKNEDLPMAFRDHALFTGYAPFVQPKYAISVVVEHGGGGSEVAAPIARDVMLFALSGSLPLLEAYPVNQRSDILIRLEKIRNQISSSSKDRELGQY